MSVKAQLQKSGKGRLSYEREDSPKAFKDFLNSCTSPPSIHVSPNYSHNQKRLNEQSNHDTENTSYKDTVNQVCRSSSFNLDSSAVITEPGNLADKSQKSITSPIISVEFNRSRCAIQKYEEDMKNNARKAHLEKKRLFEETKWRLEREAKSQLQEHEQQATFDCLKKIQNIELNHESQASEILKQHRKLKETHEQRKLVHNARIQEVEQARERIRQDELKQREQKRKALLDKINKCITDLNMLNAKIQSKYSNCKHLEHISEGAKKSLSLIQSRIAVAEKIKVEFQQSGEASLKLFEKCRDLLEQAGNAYEFVCKELENAEKEGEKKKEEAEKQANLQKQQELQQQQNQKAGIGLPLASSTPAPSIASSGIPSNFSSSTLSDLVEKEGGSLCVYPEIFTKFTELQTRLMKVEEDIAVFTSTPQLKKLKFDIQKAVNTPINAISSTSGEHLRDKLKKLLSLLSGQSVDVGGNKTVSLKQHPQAPFFCRHLIAKMVVKKGSEQVSSKHESAFAIAMVVVGLWREQPDLGDLLLAQFYQACPYLVPYYIPKQEEQSTQEHFKARGYEYDSNGAIEKQEKFLKRMSGIMRLYFAIIVSSPPRGNHPHGMEHAWSWFAQVLNLEPEPDITATMIYDFLQVVGKSFYDKYNRQFIKLLHILTKETIPKLERVSSTAGSGFLSRLKVLLENSLRNQGQFPEPEGYLQAKFWLS